MVSLWNILDIEKDSETIKLAQLGINLNKTENTIAALGKKTFMIRIPSSLSRTYCYRPGMVNEELRLKI